MEEDTVVSKTLGLTESAAEEDRMSSQVLEMLEEPENKDMKTLEETRDKDMKTLEETRDKDMKTLEEPENKDMKTLEETRDKDMKTLEETRDKDMKTLEETRDKDMKTLEETRDKDMNSEDRDVWTLEDGDDSVFYSDEDQAVQDVNGSRRLVNSEASDAPEPQEGAEPAAGVRTHLHTSPLTPETSANSWREALQISCKNPQKTEKLPAEGDVSETQPVTFDPSVDSTDDPCLSRSEPADQLMSGIRGHEQDPADPDSSDQLTGPGPDQTNPFNHLVSSYRTLSYRRIRRGNTRQKIKHFEYVMTKM